MNKTRYLPLLICLGAVSCLTKTPESTVEQPLRHVGDILENPALDTANFQPCDESLAQIYYNFGESIGYEGEKAAIIDFVYNEFQSDASIQDDGYVTVRFMVNCQGQSGRFRVYEMDRDYNLVSLSGDLVNQILDIVMGLDDWKIGRAESGEAYDYYQYLTFKIVKGQITNILP